MRRLLGPVMTAITLLSCVGSAYAITIYLNGVYVGVTCGSSSSSSIVASSSLCGLLERELSLSAASSSLARLPPVPPPPTPVPPPDPGLEQILAGVDDLVDSEDENEFTTDLILVSGRIRVFGSGAIGPVNGRLVERGIPPMDEVMPCFSDGLPDERDEAEICIQTALARSLKIFTSTCIPPIPFCIGLRRAVSARSHSYVTNDNVICDTTQSPAELCNVPFVYDLALSLNENAVPIVRSPRFAPVREGAQVVLYPINPVRIYHLSIPGFCYEVRTDPGHVLHPGRVLRCFRMVGTTVVGETLGTGEGCFALANEIGGKVLYEGVNRTLRRAFDDLAQIILNPPVPNPPPSSSI